MQRLAVGFLSLSALSASVLPFWAHLPQCFQLKLKKSSALELLGRLPSFSFPRFLLSLDFWLSFLLLLLS